MPHAANRLFRFEFRTEDSLAHYSWWPRAKSLQTISMSSFYSEIERYQFEEHKNAEIILNFCLLISSYSVLYDGGLKNFRFDEEKSFFVGFFLLFFSIWSQWRLIHFSLRAHIWWYRLYSVTQTPKISIYSIDNFFVHPFVYLPCNFSRLGNKW